MGAALAGAERWGWDVFGLQAAAEGRVLQVSEGVGGLGGERGRYERGERRREREREEGEKGREGERIETEGER